MFMVKKQTYIKKQTNKQKKPSIFILPEKETMSYRSGSQGAVPRPATAAAPENMLEMVSLRSPSRPTELDTIESGPEISTLTSPTCDSDEQSNLKITECMSYKPTCSSVKESNSDLISLSFL